MRRQIYILGLALTLLTYFLIPSGNAVTLMNGKTYFDQVPQLGDAYSTQKAVNVSGAIYYFKVTIPKDAGETLQKVEIKQFRASDDVNFDLDESQSGIAITIAPDKTVTVTFNPPIPAGETIDIKLRPERNPRYGGIYLFGVTAFPEGDDPHGQFLGFGRLIFYEGSTLSNY